MEDDATRSGQRLHDAWTDVTDGAHRERRAVPSLDGVRVLDLTENVAGPFCAQVLADLGASVLKIERPGGDPAREWGPPFWCDQGVLFLALNRSKHSIEVDLHTAEGRERVRALSRSADVVLTSFRPETTRRLGIDHETLHADNPALVICEITAFGADGPMRDRGGYDTLIQAEVGLMSLTGHPGGPPARVGTSIIDMGTGMWAVIAVLAGLRTRDVTGEGCRVHTSLFQTGLQWVSYQLMWWAATGSVPEAFGTALPTAAPYEAFEVRDGHVIIAAGTDRLFARLSDALGRAELADDPRFRRNQDRVGNRDALHEVVHGLIADLSMSEVVARLGDAGIPVAPVRTVDQLLTDEGVRAQFEALGMLGWLRADGEEAIPLVRTPVDIDACPWPVTRPPTVGEHTDGTDATRAPVSTET